MASPTPILDGGGGGKVLKILAWPQPRPLHLAVQLDGPCDAVSLRLYSMGWHRVADLTGPGCSRAGWVQVDLGGLALPSGAYYVLGQAGKGGAWGPAARGKMMFLR
jgi:hypothetical protein